MILITLQILLLRSMKTLLRYVWVATHEAILKPSKAQKVSEWKVAPEEDIFPQVQLTKLP